MANRTRVCLDSAHHRAVDYAPRHTHARGKDARRHGQRKNPIHRPSEHTSQWQITDGRILKTNRGRSYMPIQTRSPSLIVSAVSLPTATLGGSPSSMEDSQEFHGGRRRTRYAPADRSATKPKPLDQMYLSPSPSRELTLRKLDLRPASPLKNAGVRRHWVGMSSKARAGKCGPAESKENPCNRGRGT